jgi:regulator of sigma E protease
MSIFLLILGIVLFIGLVVAHEWGHFIVARRGGVQVEEFGIFFPPKLYKKRIHSKKGDFDFTINLLPLGGFVRLKGENDADRRPGSFGAAPILTKVKIMLAGVSVNLIIAVLMLFVLALIGMPKLIDNQFTIASDTKITRHAKIFADDVSKDSPASRSGLQKGDQILSIANKDIQSRQDVGQIAEFNSSRDVQIVVLRSGEQKILQARLNDTNTGNGFLGVSTGQEGVQLQRNTWSAPIVALGLTKQFTVLTFQGLGHVFSSLFKGDTKTASEQVSGPVGIVVILQEGSKIGLSFILFIIAVISLTLAIMNVLPIPALDGGRLFVTLLFHAFKKPLTKSREEWIHGTGFVVLMGLFVLITVVDVKRFF